MYAYNMLRQYNLFPNHDLTTTSRDQLAFTTVKTKTQQFSDIPYKIQIDR